MVIRGVKPQTQFAIDALLFGLLGTVIFSTLMEHAGARGAAHGRFMWHVVHGVSGGLMTMLLTVHLLLHWPWIRCQLARLRGKRDQDAPAAPAVQVHP